MLAELSFKLTLFTSVYLATEMKENNRYLFLRNLLRKLDELLSNEMRIKIL